MKLPIIHVIGLPGAGKTVLTERLRKRFRVPIYRIGVYRERFPMTAIGEADAWLALFHDLSKRRWSNCILETTGLNIRENFLSEALPWNRMIVVKLEASRKILMNRIEQKKKSEQGGKWLFSDQFQDKYDFVKKMYPRFKKTQAHFSINTDQLKKEQVFKEAVSNLKRFIE
jgi:shikimate kinase